MHTLKRRPRPLAVKAPCWTSKDASQLALELEQFLSSTAPPFPFLLLDSVPALETQRMTHPLPVLTEEAARAAASPGCPTHSLGPSSKESSAQSSWGPGPSAGWFRSSLDTCPGGCSRKETEVGICLPPERAGAQPATTKGQRLPHQGCHTQSPHFTASFFCLIVNLT